MANLTAPFLAQQALKLGLLTESQLEDCQDAVEENEESPELFLRALERKGYLTPWQSQKLLKGETDGYFLGGYRLLYRIASGSFGRVFRADDPHTGMIVAIKVLRRRWSEERRTIELFEREGKVGRSLQHPNIVQILAVDRDFASKQYYIVMEFVEGGNLRDFLAIRKKLQPAEALRLLEDAATGLAYAQVLGVSHRDIKPTNILISTQGAAKLVDFGLAGMYSAQADGKAAKTYRTVDYAGLEKATGVKSGDIRSDIYFLGCVFYEMLAGKSPLDLPADPKARMKKQRFDQALTLKPEDVTAPPSVFHLLNTMMAYKPEDRYQTPAQLLEAIRDVRRELEGLTSPRQARPAERSVFVVEKNARLQNLFRDKLKELGYRVFLSADPLLALTRYRQKPYDALVLDAGEDDEACVIKFDQIMDEAQGQNRPCAGILVLSEDQAAWAEQVQPRPRVSILIRPGVTLRQVVERLEEFVPLS
jgi:serine/threonine protein kinase